MTVEVAPRAAGGQDRRVPEGDPAGLGRWDVMVDPDGALFYPDSPADAHVFVFWFEAVPVFGPRARGLWDDRHVLCGVEPCSRCADLDGGCGCC